MPEPRTITKAFLQEIKWNKQGKVTEEGTIVEVQFNPESLKVNLSNQVAGDDNKGGSAIQFSSRGTTKLAFDMWFDVTSRQPEGRDEVDVRWLTKDIADFMKTKKKGSGRKAKYIPPGVRFQWGSFLFEGVMESMNETLEYFSEEGRPLRASVSVSLVKQDVEVKFADINTEREDQANVSTPGTNPVPQVNEGDTYHDVQQQREGNPENWQQNAFADQAEDVLRMDPEFDFSISSSLSGRL